MWYYSRVNIFNCKSTSSTIKHEEYIICRSRSMWLQVNEQVTHNKNCVSWCWYNYVTGPAKKHNIQVKIDEWKSSIIDKQVKCYLYVCFTQFMWCEWLLLLVVHRKNAVAALVRVFILNVYQQQSKMNVFISQLSISIACYTFLRL